MTALVNCEFCSRVLHEGNYDAHQDSQHPQWSMVLEKRLAEACKLLERIASAVEGLERKE